MSGNRRGLVNSSLCVETEVADENDYIDYQGLKTLVCILHSTCTTFIINTGGMFLIYYYSF